MHHTQPPNDSTPKTPYAFGIITSLAAFLQFFHNFLMNTLGCLLQIGCGRNPDPLLGFIHKCGRLSPADEIKGSSKQLSRSWLTSWDTSLIPCSGAKTLQKMKKNGAFNLREGCWVQSIYWYCDACMLSKWAYIPCTNINHPIFQNIIRLASGVTTV